jgi:hypothetical protein
VTDQQNDPPAKTPVEHAVETLVYAPIGLLFDGASLLPQLIEKGRNQVTMARMLGKFAVAQGREEASKAAGKLQDQAAGVLELIGSMGADHTGPAPEPAPAPSTKAPRPASKAPGAAQQAARKVAGVSASAPATGTAPTTTSGRAAAARTPRARPTRGAAAVVDAAGLAIPDYDGLSASHVVNRLAGLSAPELEAVRSYEAANRGRKTILSKVAQLQSS